MNIKKFLLLLTSIILLAVTGCAPYGGQAGDPGANLHNREAFPGDANHRGQGINWNISSDFTSVPSEQYPETKALQVQDAKFIYVVDGGQIHIEEGDLPAQLEGFSPEQIQQAIRDQLQGITQEQLANFTPDQLQQMIREQLERGTRAPGEEPIDATPEQPQPEQARPAPAPAQPEPEQAAPTPAPAQPEPERAAPTPAPAQPEPERAAPAPAEPEPERAAPAAGISEIEARVIELTNVERRRNGLSDLQADAQLSNVARKKSNDMRQNNYFSHTSPTYGSPFDMIRDHGVSYNAAGENIAKGQRTPEEVVQAWMNSEGHRRNILNGNFTHIGVGYDPNGHHWTQMFISR